MKLTINKEYKFIVCENVLIYLGKAGNWNKFAKKANPKKVWSEVLDSDLHLIEEV